MNRTVKGTVLATAAALAMAGCSQNVASSPAPAGSPAASAPTASAAPALPAGMRTFGTTITLSKQWTLAVGKLQQVQPTSAAKGLPSGWIGARSDFRFTNTSTEILNVPALEQFTARYGPDGKEAQPFTDTGLPGLPDHSLTSATEPQRVAPGSTFTAPVGLAVPASAAGQPLTLTLPADIGTAYVEAPFPGATPHTAQPFSAKPAPADKKALAFGEWHYTGREVTWLRMARPSAVGTDDKGQRQYAVDLTFFNPDTEVSGATQTPVDMNVHVYYGTALKTADTVKEWQGLRSGFIAPQRTATVTAHFTLPSEAVPGPVTIEAGSSSDTPVTFTGDVGN